MQHFEGVVSSYWHVPQRACMIREQSGDGDIQVFVRHRVRSEAEISITNELYQYAKRVGHHATAQDYNDFGQPIEPASTKPPATNAAPTPERDRVAQLRTEVEEVFGELCERHQMSPLPIDHRNQRAIFAWQSDAGRYLRVVYEIERPGRDYSLAQILLGQAEVQCTLDNALDYFAQVRGIGELDPDTRSWRPNLHRPIPESAAQELLTSPDICERVNEWLDQQRLHKEALAANRRQTVNAHVAQVMASPETQAQVWDRHWHLLEKEGPMPVFWRYTWRVGDDTSAEAHWRTHDVAADRDAMGSVLSRMPGRTARDSHRVWLSPTEYVLGHRESDQWIITRDLVASDHYPVFADTPEATQFVVSVPLTNKPTDREIEIAARFQWLGEPPTRGHGGG